MTDKISRLEKALDDKDYAVATAQQKLEQYDAEISSIHAEIDKNSEGLSVTARRDEEQDKNPKNISAEDAFDTAIRLESTIKIINQRNALLVKDNVSRGKAFRDLQKKLQAVTSEENKIVAATGFNPDVDDPAFDNVDENHEKTEKAIELGKQMEKEIAAAELQIKKKRELILRLTGERDALREKENELCQIYNDTRCADRDCQEATATRDQMKASYEKTEAALALTHESSGASLAVGNMQSDCEYLREEVRRHKADKRTQEKIQRAQLARTQQLQTRLDVIMDSVRAMKMGKDLERHVGAGAAVPAASGDPEDIDRILPPNEELPVETYELLHRDCEAMRSIADRKLILVTEKSCTIDAQEGQIAGMKAQLQMAEKQQDKARVNCDIEQSESVQMFARRHAEFREELGKLVMENTRLKAIDQQLGRAAITVTA